MMTNTQYLLVKLAEEAAEVAQKALKAAHLGMEEVEPDQSFTNAERLQLELDDMHAIVTMLNMECAFAYTPSLLAVSVKRDKVRRYRDYSIGLGLVKETK